MHTLYPNYFVWLDTGVSLPHHIMLPLHTLKLQPRTHMTGAGQPEKKQRNPGPTGAGWLRLIFMLIKTILGGRQWGYNPAREAILTARGRSLPLS